MLKINIRYEIKQKKGQEFTLNQAIFGQVGPQCDGGAIIVGQFKIGTTNVGFIQEHQANIKCGRKKAGLKKFCFTAQINHAKIVVVVKINIYLFGRNVPLFLMHAKPLFRNLHISQFENLYAHI